MFPHTVLTLGLVAIAQCAPISINFGGNAAALVVPARRVEARLPLLHKRSSSYTVVDGDTGDAIAAAKGVAFSALEAVNAGVNWNDLQIGQTLQLPGGSSSADVTVTLTSTAMVYTTSVSSNAATTTAAPVTTAISSTIAQAANPSSTVSSGSSSSNPSITSTNKLTNSNAVSSINDNDGNNNPSGSYTLYSGDGSTGAGWPAQSEWASFDAMWTANSGTFGQNCQSSFNVPNNSPAETTLVRAAVEAVAAASGVDHRFILATILQESGGCVRVPTTTYSVSNPGLMQSFEGTGSCNGASGVQTPCSATQIFKMVQDGTMGTSPGSSSSVFGLTDATGSGAQAYYQAARMYNSGSVAPSGNLQCGVATQCYASDVANRLMGWATAAHGCTTSSFSACE